jgi:hypothetical protein
MTAAVLVKDITCQGCKRTCQRQLSDEMARAVGWRIWDGETLGGKEVSVRLCPVCAGTATPDQEVELLSYAAGCHTCGADMADESREKPGHVFTQEEAEEWRDYHRCEADTYITKPPGVAS